MILRLSYGLEVVQLSKTDISNLITCIIYFVKLFKRIKHISSRTTNTALLLINGQIPIEAEFHKRIIGIFKNIINNDNFIERNLAVSVNLQ